MVIPMAYRPAHTLVHAREHLQPRAGAHNGPGLAAVGQTLRFGPFWAIFRYFWGDMSVILWLSWPSIHPTPRGVLRSVSNHQITLPTAHGAELELKNTDFCQFSV